MLRFHDTVHAGSCDGMTPITLADPSVHLLDDLPDLHRVRSNSQYVERRTFKLPVVRSPRHCFGGVRWFCQNCVNGDPQIAERSTL